MADNPATLAQAAAQIDRLQAALAQAEIDRDAAQANLATANAALADAQAAPSADPAVTARLAELESYLADPPAGSDITVVRRYRTADGTKHKLLPDAQHRKRVLAMLALPSLRLTETQAEDAVMNGDAIVKALS
jgi:hypothetical protein